MIIHAGADNDAMIGGTNSDGLWGGAGIDILIGGANNDMLAGESGNDYLLGGIGNDTYIFATGDGTDTVLDTDGSGSIILDGVTLTGGALVAGATNVWKNADAMIGGTNSDGLWDGTGIDTQREWKQAA